MLQCLIQLVAALFSREMPATDVGALCRVQLETQGPPLLSLSADEALLAVCSGPSVEVGGFVHPTAGLDIPLGQACAKLAC